jgi:CRISPR-associated endonuclease/helicase Cas3
VGALIAKAKKGAGPLAFVVAGHHGGMPNSDDLAGRLIEKAELLPEARRDGLPQWIEKIFPPRPPDWLANPLADRIQLSLWTRVLFSALVDADFLNTEKFYGGGIARAQAPQPSLAELKARLDAYFGRKTAASDPSPMNEMRARVLEACRTKAASELGKFTLTVPNGLIAIVGKVSLLVTKRTGSQSLPAALFLLPGTAKIREKLILVAPC